MIDPSKLSAAPWEVELRGHKSDETTHYAVLTPKRNVVCDTVNTEVALIETDFDESGGTPCSIYRDVQGREDMQFIALARNAFQIMLDRRWYAGPCAAGGWEVFYEDGTPLDDSPNVGLADPFTAIVRADAWMKEQERKP